jgi:hypothetical protein
LAARAAGLLLLDLELLMATPAQTDPAQITGQVLFYSSPEPLNAETHAKIGLRRLDKPFAFASKSHVVPLTVTEFPVACLSYPVIFAGDKYQPLAVMGINQEENLFIQSDGGFVVGAYIPAYIRRYPFVLANDAQNQQLVVCIDRGAGMLGELPDLPFFDAKGQPTEYTQGCIQFCNEFEGEARRTESFVELLRGLDLFEVRHAQYTPVNPDGTAGEPQQIAEYFAVSEEKLRALPADKIKELFENGALAQIYAHLSSLNGWDRLIALAIARQQAQLTIPANLN